MLVYLLEKMGYNNPTTQIGRIGILKLLKKKKLGNIKNYWQLYVMLLPALIYLLVFNYLPLYGIQVAFRDYRLVDGVMGSPWVGLKHFKRFFDAYYFERLIKNTLVLNINYLLWSFPFPIIIAILLNQIRSDKRKRFVQTTIYVPHFISTVVMAGMIYLFLSPSGGILNSVMGALGLAPLDLMSEAGAFRSIYTVSGVWQGAGYSSILFVATLAGIDPSLYEAAEIDGASIWKKIRYIDIPSILPTAAMVLILDFGKLMNSNTDKVLLLQTAGNISTSDIIGTYVFNVGVQGGQFSYTAAIGLFSNLVNLALILLFNKISKKISNIGLF